VQARCSADAIQMHAPLRHCEWFLRDQEDLFCAPDEIAVSTAGFVRGVMRVSPLQRRTGDRPAKPGARFHGSVGNLTHSSDV
jgi:hypothetical protein